MTENPENLENRNRRHPADFRFSAFYSTWAKTYSLNVMFRRVGVVSQNN